jgi:hypothetical protein
MKTSRLIALVAGLIAVAMLTAVVASAAPAKPAAKPKAAQAGPRRGGPGGGGPRMDAGEMLNRWAKMLGLSAAQKAKAKPIFDSQVKQFKALQGNKKADPRQMGQKMGAVMRDSQAKLRKILTPAQLRKLDDMELGLDGMGKMLGLSEAQKAKIRPILMKQRSQMTAIFGNNKLSQDQKMAKLKPIGQAAEAQINKILTAAQKKKLADMRKQMGGAPGGGGRGMGGGMRGMGGPRGGGGKAPR